MQIPSRPFRHEVAGDTLRIDVVGLVELADIHAVQQASAGIACRAGYYLVLADVSRMLGITPPASQQLARGHFADACAGLAIVGARLVAKTLISMIVHSIKLLCHQSIPTAFFATEAEAQAWLAGRRELRLASLPRDRSRGDGLSDRTR